MVLSLLLLAWKHYKVHTASIRTAFVTANQNIISTTRYPLPKRMTNVNISIRRLEHTSLHSIYLLYSFQLAGGVHKLNEIN